ncbi:collagen alpha-6(VI) chain-like [Rhea pennata]|uniref:collagen alpha-6(VI) chain-like n=1 Tax=Rhea pennata TaxID=8795 RepID=UPI002E2632C4
MPGCRTGCSKRGQEPGWHHSQQSSGPADQPLPPGRDEQSRLVMLDVGLDADETWLFRCSGDEGSCFVDLAPKVLSEAVQSIAPLSSAHAVLWQSFLLVRATVQQLCPLLRWGCAKSVLSGCALEVLALGPHGWCPRLLWPRKPGGRTTLELLRDVAPSARARSSVEELPTPQPCVWHVGADPKAGSGGTGLAPQQERYRRQSKFSVSVPADIVLLVDSSEAMESSSLPYVKKFMTQMINSLPIGPNQFRLALAQYSDEISVEFMLDTYQTKSAMVNHIRKNFTFTGGSAVKTGAALAAAYETLFQKSTNGKEKQKIVVVLTSAPSEDDVEDISTYLQSLGVKIIAIGTKEALHNELFEIATPPFHYKNPAMEELPKFSQNMPHIIADIIQVKVSDLMRTDLIDFSDTAVQEACDRDLVADIVFIVDRGTSKSNFEDLKKFLQNLIRFFDVKQKCIRIGLMTYTDTQEVVFRLNTDLHKTEFLQKIQDLPAEPGEANTGAAINTTRLKLFSERAGSRRKQGVEQIAVLVTHRLSQDNVSDAAALLRRRGVALFAIGIESASDQQLVQIASYPQEQYVTSLKTFSDLQNQHDFFQKKILNQIQNNLYVQSEKKMTLKTGCKETEEADIYFLIDGSWSLDYSDFLDMKNFLKEVIRHFSVGLNRVRFGLVQFSHIKELEFEINKYKTTSDLMKAIENVRQIGGNTSTGEALAYMKPLFEKARKQRGVTISYHLVVLTDGESQDSVKEPAMELREDQINIYAIGVREANKTQLYEIAGAKKRVYFVHNFDLLRDIKNEVIQEICTKEACKEMEADIMFLVDSSASIGDTNFLKMKTFMRGLVDRTDVGADKVQIGVVQFSHEPKEEFQLNTYSSKKELFRAIDRISPLQSTTLTGQALKFMPKYFQASTGSRPRVKKILILITDGEAQDDVKAPATALREKGIIIYSVGVFNANKTQLEEISGKHEMVFYVENFDILKRIKDALIFHICSIPSEARKRVERLDIVFVIDSSGSINFSQYQTMKDFMVALVNKSDVGPDGVQFGALKYSDQPEILFHLSKYTTKLEITEAIQSDNIRGGGTYTAKALTHSEMLFAEAHGSRKSRGVPQVLIVITDGVSHDETVLGDVALRLRNKGIVIYAVGVEGARQKELLEMAGSEDKCFYVNTFEGLRNLTANVTRDICDLSPPHCPKQADVIFLIDGSRKIDKEDFRKMKDFVKNVADPVVTAQNTKIGVAQYSNDYEEEFSLGTFSNRSDLEFKIKSIKQIKGHRSDLENALQKVKLYFQPERGSRIYENIQQILLVITTGRKIGRATRAAESLRQRGVDIYAIGVGNIDHSQLTQITGTSSRKFAVDDFSKLKTIEKRLVDVICEDDSRKVACFVDVTVGFDISSQREGHYLFHGQTKLEKHLPEILQALLSLGDVSCNVGSKAQSSVAVKVENTITPVSAKFRIDRESVLNNLTDAVIRGPSQLNVEFLQSLWETFQSVDDTRKKVLLVFSDGVDDDLEALEQKSEELKKKGLDALITVALEGASNFKQLRSIEFGKGFEYDAHLSIDMTDIASRLSKMLNNIAERTCCSVACKCIGEEGEIGDRGKQGIKGPDGVKGHAGYFGDEGETGPRGPPGQQGRYGGMGCPGKRGQKGFRGFVGKMGDKGDDGIDGIGGAEGFPGIPGEKGEKGDIGYPGFPGPRGPQGDRGQKGFRGDFGNPGLNNDIAGEKGFKGEIGEQGERGQQGSDGFPGAAGNMGLPGQRGQQGPEGSRGQPGQDGLQGKQGYRGPQGQRGIQGQKGEKGRPGYKGPPQEPGAVGPAGSPGIPGETGNKGRPGDPGPKGERGPYGLRGRRGEDGAFAYGLPGRKGVKGYRGLPGDSGLKGAVRARCFPWEGEPGAEGGNKPGRAVPSPRGAGPTTPAREQGRLVGNQGQLPVLGFGHLSVDGAGLKLGQLAHRLGAGSGLDTHVVTRSDAAPGWLGKAVVTGLGQVGGLRIGVGICRGQAEATMWWGCLGASPRGASRKGGSTQLCWLGAGPEPRHQTPCGGCAKGPAVLSDGLSGGSCQFCDEQQKYHMPPCEKTLKLSCDMASEQNTNPTKINQKLNKTIATESKDRQGNSGPPGLIGSPGDRGSPGRRGSKGLTGKTLYSPCELIDYIRRHSRCWDGKIRCPLHPTDLVFALDISRTVTPEMFEQMREIMIAILNHAKIRDSDCPVGARVAVISYSSVAHHLIRFSEFRNKNKLLDALKSIRYESSSSERDIGNAMTFVARNVFKRTIQGPNVRKIAVVFSHGPSENAASVKQAVLEMSAMEVVPVVFAFQDTPSVSQAFLMDDSGLFQVLNVRGWSYNETLQSFHLCTLCYDKCNPGAFCERPRRRLPRAYVDAAFVLDSSQKMSGAEFDEVKDFISKAVTTFNISSDPKTSTVGDRIAVVSHTLPDFKPGTGRKPIKKEFDLITYGSGEQIRKYLKESLQQRNGEAALGYAIKWTIANIFSGVPNPRQLKVIIIVSAGKTSQWDRETLKRTSLEAKCQGYALLTISLGKSFDRNELEELASTPLEQHLVQLGRIHKPALDYVTRFLKPFIYFLRSDLNSYPPEELKAKCSSLSFQSERYM